MNVTRLTWSLFVLGIKTQRNGHGQFFLLISLSYFFDHRDVLAFSRFIFNGGLSHVGDRARVLV